MAPQSDEANLARIRDNQRRSRARRKEYQQELEQRVRAFEELGVEASTEVQQAARRVAEENRKLRALLQNNGISHASIEAYLQTGDYPAATAGTLNASGSTTATASTSTTGINVSALDHLMVRRFPAHYVSPLGGATATMSVSGSVGPSSPAGGSVGGDGGGGGGGGGGSDWEASITRDVGVLAPHSSTSSPTIALRNMANRASGSHRSHRSHRSSSDNNGKNASTGAAASSSSQRHMASAAMMQTATAAAADYTAGGSSNTDYLTPGFGLSSAAFYGLEGASTEDLQYTSNDQTFFDYSASPHYYGGSGGGNVAAMGSSSSTGNAMPGITQTPGTAAYYGQVPNIMPTSGACPACLSGMGCQVHGGFYEEQ